MSELDPFFEAFGDALAPVFEEQRAVWDANGPAAMSRVEALGIAIDEIGGNCPVQAEGSFDDQRFYFRARGDEWQFHAWNAPGRYLDPNRDQDEWLVERDYGSGFDAGWMPKHEAIGLICDCVEQFRTPSSGMVPADPEQGS